MDVLVAIILTTAIAIVAVMIGFLVQRISKFIYPLDFMTIGILIAVIAKIVLDLVIDTIIPQIDPYWYLPFAVGYITGYVIAGRQEYMMVESLDFTTKSQEMMSWVVYKEDGRTFIQTQKNRELAKRLLMGIKHPFESNVPIGDFWDSKTKFPLFPLFKSHVMHVESYCTSYVPRHVWWKFFAKQYTTTAILAYGDIVSKWKLMVDGRALEESQQQVVDLTKRVNELERMMGPKLLEYAMNMDVRSTQTAPENRMLNLLKDMEKRKIEKKPKEDKKEEIDDGSEQERTAIKQ